MGSALCEGACQVLSAATCQDCRSLCSVVCRATQGLRLSVSFARIRRLLWSSG